MKFYPISIIVFLIFANLLFASPSWADKLPTSVNHSDTFEVGQKVIWLYKVRADAPDTQKIPAEVIKVGSKQVQIKIRKNNHEFIHRWVSRNRLEKIPTIEAKSSNLIKITY